VISIYFAYRSSFFKTLQREESIYRIEFEGLAKDLFEFDSHDRNRSIL